MLVCLNVRVILVFSLFILGLFYVILNFSFFSLSLFIFPCLESFYTGLVAWNKSYVYVYRGLCIITADINITIKN